MSCGFAVNFRALQIVLGAIQRRVDEAKNHACNASRPTPPQSVVAVGHNATKFVVANGCAGGEGLLGKGDSAKPQRRGARKRGGTLQGRDTKNDEEAEKSTDTSQADLNVKDDEKQPVFVPAARARVCEGDAKIARAGISIVHMQKAHIGQQQ
jgi:hypothetical protein